MEVDGGEHNKFKVCLYELLGTSMLTYAVLASGGSGPAVAFTFFITVLYVAPITGGHINPAVSTAVFVNRKNYAHDLNFYLMIMASQFAGGILGCFWSWLILMPRDLTLSNFAIPKEWVVALCPTGVFADGTLERPCDTEMDRDRAAAFSQLFGTFLFIFTIMIVKGKATAPTSDSILGPLTVAISLFSQICVLNVQGGACYNPAVAVAILVFGSQQDKGPVRTSEIHYMWIFIFVPYIAGAIAGYLQIHHNRRVASLQKLAAVYSDDK